MAQIDELRGNQAFRRAVVATLAGAALLAGAAGVVGLERSDHAVSVASNTPGGQPEPTTTTDDNTPWD